MARAAVDGAYWVVMTKPAATRRHLPASPFKVPVAPPLQQFAVGNRVAHDEHGLGRVIGVEDQSAVLVDFGPFTKRITVPFAKMTKL